GKATQINGSVMARRARLSSARRAAIDGVRRRAEDRRALPPAVTEALPRMLGLLFNGILVELRLGILVGRLQLVHGEFYAGLEVLPGITGCGLGLVAFLFRVITLCAQR